MSRAQEEGKLTLEEEVNQIFRSIYHKPISIKPKVIITSIQTFGQIRDFMKINAQEIVNEALKRAVRRDASLSTLEVGDLLWAI